MAMKKEAQEKLKAEQLRKAQAVVSNPWRCPWGEYHNNIDVFIYGMHCGGCKYQKEKKKNKEIRNPILLLLTRLSLCETSQPLTWLIVVVPV